MRKSWIIIGMIALLVGLAAGYRMGRPGNSSPASPPADRDQEAAPAESVERKDPRASPQTAPSALQPPAEQPVWRPPAQGVEARSPLPAESETKATPTSAKPTSAKGQEAAVVRGSTASAPLQGDKVAAPVVPPVPDPRAPPNATGAQTQEPAEGNGAPVPTDDPESDRHPPVLQFLRFDPVEIQDGGTAVLSIGTTDDLSGVKSVFGTVRSPSEAAIVPFSAQDAAGGGVFSVRVAIPRQAETGDWFVGTLQIVDKADNPLTLAFTKTSIPQGGALRVVSQESDSTAPNVIRVSIDKGTVDAGEQNRIFVDVDDDRSGVASVTGTFQSPSKLAFIPFACRPNGDSTTWEGDVPTPANADCGEWTLMLLRVADKANNTAIIAVDSPQVGPVSFVVAGGGGCDRDPPVVDALYLSPTSVSNTAAAEITLTVSAHDDGSGVGSLSGRVEGPVAANGQVPRIFFACTPDPKNPGAPMTATISVSQYAAKGIWRVSLVQVMDKARNTRAYTQDDPALRDAGFSVE